MKAIIIIKHSEITNNALKEDKLFNKKAPLYIHSSLTGAKLSHAEERVWSNSFVLFKIFLKLFKKVDVGLAIQF